MDAAPVVRRTGYSSEVRCCNCNTAPLSIADTWEVFGVSPICGACAKKCAKPEHVFRCVPCEECGCPTANTIFDARGLFVCGSCHDRQRQHSPAQSPGASHAPASATASASPAGAAAGDVGNSANRSGFYLDWVEADASAAGKSARRTCKLCGEKIRPGYPQVVGADVCMRCWPEYVAQCRNAIAASPSPLAPNPSPLVWYHRPLLTAGLPIGVASLLLIAAAVDRVVDSGAPWHEVGEILSAMAPVLATFGIILALALGWMLRSLSNGLRDARDHGPEADAGLRADYNDAVEALKDAHSLIIRHHDSTVTRIAPGHFCPVCHRPDGSEPEIDRLHSAIQRHKNHPNLKS